MNKSKKVDFIKTITLGEKEKCFKDDEIKMIRSINSRLINDCLHGGYTDAARVQKFEDAVLFRELIKELESYRYARKEN